MIETNCEITSLYSYVAAESFRGYEDIIVYMLFETTYMMKSNFMMIVYFFLNARSKCEKTGYVMSCERTRNTWGRAASRKIVTSKAQGTDVGSKKGGCKQRGVWMKSASRMQHV